ncbi:hypothetical protein ACLI38_35130, partial [Pseudomonas aeruginosa]
PRAAAQVYKRQPFPSAPPVLRQPSPATEPAPPAPHTR